MNWTIYSLTFVVISSLACAGFVAWHVASYLDEKYQEDSQ
jgi:hypothetical protein